MNNDRSYINWRQDDPRFNEREAWPKEDFPDAGYHYFRESGCLVCSLAIMLRHTGIERETDESRFNPWILNQKLIEIGAFDPEADLELEDIPKMYPVSYLGEVPYSLEKMRRYSDEPYACLITVPGKKAAEHFTAFYRLLEEDVIVTDPLCGLQRLSQYEKVNAIRVFRKTLRVTHGIPE